MEVSFVKFSPTQNVTILVESPVPRQAQPALAARLLAYDGVGGEQVGFLEAPTPPGARARLQMMGGEFCGNATMSVGAYLAWKAGLPDGEGMDCPLEVSGAEGRVSCRILRRGDAFQGTVQMPLPEKFGRATLPADGGNLTLPAVFLPGIVHLIAERETGLSREEIERRIRDWNQILGAEALGVLRYDAESGRMEPIVYVPATDSAVWEHGCGSGTAALGCWKAHSLGKSYRGVVNQPGGQIGVDVQVERGRIAGLTITGTVRIVASGTAYV